jgi:hypothetical protein
MERNKTQFAKKIDYYQPLLQRYARFILKDEEVAKKLVKKVLEDQFEFNDLVPSDRLRKILKADLLNYCYYWQQSQIFDRPLIKVPLRKYARTSQIWHE